MKTSHNRQTVDLTGFSQLVVVYLGMRVNTLTGMKALLGLGPQIATAGRAMPDGLLHFENNIIYSLFPFHVGMRWYWRDFESMEQWTRSPPHREWWQSFMKRSRGVGFWHEAYFMGGGMEAIYTDVRRPIGFQAFAPSIAPRGAAFTARRRLGQQGSVAPAPQGVSETELY